MPETPHDRFEYPPAEEPLWYEKGLKRTDLSEGARASLPPEFFEQMYDGFVDWLEQLEIKVQGMVTERIDLPDPDPNARVSWTLPNGNDATQRRVFIILDEAAIVYDDGSSWETLAGLGSEESPVPPIYTDAVTTPYIDAGDVNADAVDGDSLARGGQYAYSPQLIDHHYQLDTGPLDVSFDTRDYPNGEIKVLVHVTTAGEYGPEDIEMHVSQYDGPNYRQVNMSGSGINNSQGNTSWTLGSVGQQFGQISGRYYVSRPRSRGIIQGSAAQGAGTWDSDILQRGALIGTDVFSIDTIELFTSGNIYKAEIELWGHKLRDFPIEEEV